MAIRARRRRRDAIRTVRTMARSTPRLECTVLGFCLGLVAGGAFGVIAERAAMAVVAIRAGGVALRRRRRLVRMACPARRRSLRRVRLAVASRACSVTRSNGALLGRVAAATELRLRAGERERVRCMTITAAGLAGMERVFGGGLGMARRTRHRRRRLTRRAVRSVTTDASLGLRMLGLDRLMTVRARSLLRCRRAMRIVAARTLAVGGDV